MINISIFIFFNSLIVSDTTEFHDVPEHIIEPVPHFLNQEYEKDAVIQKKNKVLTSSLNLFPISEANSRKKTQSYKKKPY